ncbi:MAG: DUF4215 domain-containing protein [Sandaracinaceae bacterium]
MGNAARYTVLAWLVLACGCSVLVDGTLADKDGVDGGADAGDTDGGATCADANDGDACGEGLICLDGACGPSLCGDGFVDVDGGEECEDGNDIPTDGCEPEVCVFSCGEDADCDDGNPCNGSEVCSGANVCEAGSPPDVGAACVVEDVADGVCGDGEVCIPRGCGDGVVGGEEACDDGNTDAGDGCEPDCTYTCEGDEGCLDDQYCNGEETCDVTTHTCNAGTPVVCDASDECHTSVCSDEDRACVESLIDEDGDGEASIILGECGTDCDDTTPERASSNAEVCGNGVDDDCDPATTDAAMTPYYPDCDSDGFAAGGTTGVVACMAPATCGGCDCIANPPPTSPENQDCADNSEDARPGQTSYFSTAIPSGDFDYNCDGEQTRRWQTTGVSTSRSCPARDPRLGCNVFELCFPGPCPPRAGWTSSFAPFCGNTASYTYCRDTGTSCVRTTVTRRQECR